MAFETDDKQERARREGSGPMQAFTAFLPKDLHPATQALVVGFAQALALKLRKAEEKYGYDNGWQGSAWMEECQAHLLEHVAKGDPRDVAAYCAFMWHHGWPTKSTSAESAVERKPHLIADAASEADKSRAWLWLRDFSLSDAGSAATLAALALDEWTRCKEIADASTASSHVEAQQDTSRGAAASCAPSPTPAAASAPSHVERRP